MIDFSVLETTLETIKALSVPIANEEGFDGAPQSAHPTRRFEARPAALLHWCRGTERVVARRSAGGETTVFAGFERFSRARFAASRYLQIRSACHELFVFGQPDAELAFPVTRAVEIERGPLLREWFLIVLSDRYDGLLSARDLDGFDTRVRPSERRFEGVITHHRETIQRVAEALRDRMAAHP